MRDNVTLIPARRISGNSIKKENKKKLRVAAYCRVSTDSDEQAGSYETQVRHYTEYIKGNSDWEFAGVYADDGISGTNTKKREEFLRMIDDCLSGKIDKIITKSISRFARNTIDCLRYVRQLKDKNISIFFEKENINTLEASGELLLTIMASLAQQESASLSQNVKLGLQFRYQNGQVQINHNHFLGYTKDENGKLIIVKEEAAIVKRIYREFLDGYSLREIAEGLEKDGIKTGGKRSKWHLSTVLGILKNEKYIGDALLQKTITTDFIEKVRTKNDGSVPQYYVRDDHEAIIPRDIFTNVQQELLRRTNITSGRKDEHKRQYSSRYALSSRCFCSKCGDIYRRVPWSIRGKHFVVWRCCTRMKEGPDKCDAPTIKEEELQTATVEAINRVLKCSSEMKDKLKRNVVDIIQKDVSSELQSLESILLDKQKKLMNCIEAKKDYSALLEEIDDLRNKKRKYLVEQADSEACKERIAELNAFIDEMNTELDSFDDLLVRKYIEKIMIHDDRFEFLFKAQIEVTIPR